MRMIGALLVGAGLLLVAPRPAGAVPASPSEQSASHWLAGRVTADGFIESDFNPGQPDLGTSAQAVLALAASGEGGDQVDALEGYLAAHVDDYVKPSGPGTADAPGSLAFLILGAVATGRDPHAFGGTDLVARLEATEQGSGLFGEQDPSFDGAFRQGVSLLALGAIGQVDSGATQWLVDQQCPDGSWTAYRADTSQPCPAVDPNNFTGPDTNSTALAALGLRAAGTSPGADPVAWLDSVRTADGGWGYLGTSDEASDADSTGLVMAAMRTVGGSFDQRGAAVLEGLQVGCDGAESDRGGIAFQPDPSGLVPNALATTQALFGLSGVVWPQVDATIEPGVSDPCAPATTSTTEPTTSTTSVSTTVATGAGSGEGDSSDPVETGELARTGPVVSGPALAWLSFAGVALVTTGSALVVVSARARRRMV